MDNGSHSGNCATAEGAECYCDCHGTAHGVTHMPGKPSKHGEDVDIVAIRGSTGVYYKVTGKDGLAPGGGTVAERVANRTDKVKVIATSKRTKTLPPPVKALAKKVREGLPKGFEGWDSTIPRAGESPWDRINLIKEGAEATLGRIHARYDEVFDRIVQNMKDEGLSPAQIERLSRPEVINNRYIELGSLEMSKRHTENDIKRWEEVLAGSSKTPDAQYKMDRSGKHKVPPPQLKKHLEEVLDVGQQAIAAIKAEFARDPEIAAQRKIIEESNRNLRSFESGNEAARAIRRRESEIVREMLGEARAFGGVTHTAKPVPFSALPDWRERLDTGEKFFPADWLKKSAANPLYVDADDRAYYNARGNTIALDKANYKYYNGAFADSTDEVTVHELGHRMEQYIPGLTHLEFAFVRKRSTNAHGTVERTLLLTELYKGRNFKKTEVAFPDRWRGAYAGKTYEDQSNDPARAPWEVFQVGLQDLYGRSNDRYCDDDELQAFVVGALLTLS